MILSILVCTIEERKESFRPLREHIEAQIMKQPTETVELLICCDNREKTTGEKRDFLLRNCNGKYNVNIDCDDWIPGYYVDEFIKAVESDPDCVPIDGIYTRDGVGPIKWRMSKDYPNVTIQENGENIFLRSVNHIAAVRTKISRKSGYPFISNGEDKAYAEGILPYLKTEVKIPRHMYDYRYSSLNKLYK